MEGTPEFNDMYTMFRWVRQNVRHGRSILIRLNEKDCIAIRNHDGTISLREFGDENDTGNDRDANQGPSARR